MNKKPIDISQTPIHLGADDQPLAPLEGFTFDPASFESYINSHCSTGPGRLMMIETTPESWKSWERHTKGDEIVLVLEGVGTFIQEIDGEIINVAVTAGDVLINPKGVWHTADVVEPIKAVYLTPCPGTEHKER